jgi:hypothetical protein
LVPNGADYFSSSQPELKKKKKNKNVGNVSAYLGINDNLLLLHVCKRELEISLQL